MKKLKSDDKNELISKINSAVTNNLATTIFLAQPRKKFEIYQKLRDLSLTVKEWSSRILVEDS